MKEVFWITSDADNPAGRLAIVSCPRGGKPLQDELLHMKNAGVMTVVSMLEPREADLLGLEYEHEFAEEIGLNFLSYPVRDGSVPADKATFRRFISGLAARVRKGEAIGVHCRGCIGRSTIAAACTLIHLGWTAQKAVNAIEAARGCLVPDTEEQREWIFRYEANP